MLHRPATRDPRADRDRFRFSQRERRKRVDGERAAREGIAMMRETSREPEHASIEEPEA